MSKRWETLAAVIEKNNVKTYCEVGVRNGNTISYVVRRTGVKAIAVDPWENVPNEGESYDHWDFEQIKKEFFEKTKGLDIQVIQKLSLDAAKDVDFVDMVWIDAAHDYPNCHADILAWGPKCRIISGHDYDDKFPGVKQAVDELVPDRKLEANAIWWYEQ